LNDVSNANSMHHQAPAALHHLFPFSLQLNCKEICAGDDPWRNLPTFSTNNNDVNTCGNANLQYPVHLQSEQQRTQRTHQVRDRVRSPPPPTSQLLNIPTVKQFPSSRGLAHLQSNSINQNHMNTSPQSGNPSSSAWPAGINSLSTPCLHSLGWIEYALPDTTFYYVHPTLLVTTDINLHSMKKLKAVTVYFDRKDSAFAGSSWICFAPLEVHNTVLPLVNPVQLVCEYELLCCLYYSTCRACNKTCF